MVTNIQQAAKCDYLFVKHFAHCKFKPVLAVYPYGRNPVFVALQNFIVQCVVPEQVRYRVRRRQQENRLLIAPHHFGLVTVFLVTCLAVRVEFAQIVLVKFDALMPSVMCAKILFVFDIRKLSNVFLLFRFQFYT